MTPDALHPLIEPHVPGCPVGQMNLAIRLAASDFCARTKCWRQTVTIEVEDTDYTAHQPTLPAHSVIHEIEAAWFDGNHLEPRAFADFDPDELANEEGVPAFITQRGDGHLRTVPRSAGTLVAHLLLKPPAGVDGPAVFTLPDFLVQQQAEGLAAGALWRLLVMPKKAWSDPNAAAAQRALSEQAIDRMMGRNQRGQQKAPRRTRGHFM